ncbi:hypothetical protein L596_027874 [Steinernema carpocapsae]|uniref:RRM domain-containing protein n=1 Tax=Steinernema carpocapsae TaxID=34508 RepID=A0A4U5LWU5_STECR|nr:hypothetical protein L596_027874 [Steinernema carpocapsae]
MSSGLVEMSLDDIIASKKKGRGGAGGKFTGRRSGGDISPRQPRGEGRAMFSRNVPEGKWKHDKFHEMYNNGPRVGGRGARSAPGDNRVVKINIGNLAKSVVTADLEELFGSYKPTNVAVHYDEAGRSLGTADVFLHRRESSKLLQDFQGISLDARMTPATAMRLRQSLM